MEHRGRERELIRVFRSLVRRQQRPVSRGQWHKLVRANTWKSKRSQAEWHASRAGNSLSGKSNSVNLSYRVWNCTQAGRFVLVKVATPAEGLEGSLSSRRRDSGVSWHKIDRYFLSARSLCSYDPIRRRSEIEKGVYFRLKLCYHKHHQERVSPPLCLNF